MSDSESGQTDAQIEINQRLRLGLIFSAMRSQWRLMLTILLLTVASSLTVALQPWPIKLVADYALGGTSPPSAIDWFLAEIGVATGPRSLILVAAVMSLGLTVFTVVLGNALTLLWEAAGQRMVFALTVRTFDHLQRLSLAFHHVQPVGDSMSRLVSDSWAVYTGANTAFITPITRGVTILTIAAAAWQLDSGLTIVMLFTVPVLATSAAVIGSVINRQSYRAREARSRVSAFAQQTLAALPLVRAFGTESKNRKQFVSLAQSSASAAEREVVVTRFFGMVNGMTLTLGVSVVLYFGAVRVLDGVLTIGTLLVFVAYVRTLDGQLRGVLNLYGQFRGAEAGLDRILELLALEQVPPEPDEPVDFPPLRPPEADHALAIPAVSFKHVTFGYAPGRPVIRDLSLDVAAGERVAIVGRTGSGKSSLISLLARFYDPWDGSVEIEGTDIRSVRSLDLRKQLSVVDQNPAFLPTTISENIAYARPEATFDQIRDAAKAANADEFISQLPSQFETTIGERGATLSGGQRQRLAIARALLKEAPILILDEPTSSLDVETEQLVMEALERLQQNRTTILIAHRLATVETANRIVVIDEGVIVEQGSHDDLLAIDGLYARLLAIQRKGEAV